MYGWWAVGDDITYTLSGDPTTPFDRAWKCVVRATVEKEWRHFFFWFMVNQNTIAKVVQFYVQVNIWPWFCGVDLTVPYSLAGVRWMRRVGVHVAGVMGGKL